MTTPDLPTTPRAALLALADLIDSGEFMRHPDGFAVRMAGILRTEAERYPDEPGTLSAELISAPSLDVDQQLRVQALQAASRCAHGGMGAADVIAIARTFEAYLRGDQ